MGVLDVFWFQVPRAIEVRARRNAISVKCINVMLLTIVCLLLIARKAKFFFFCFFGCDIWHCCISRLIYFILKKKEWLTNNYFTREMDTWDLINKSLEFYFTIIILQNSIEREQFYFQVRPNINKKNLWSFTRNKIFFT